MLNLRRKVPYQKQATTLWTITRNCSGTYRWFTHPTTGQNCINRKRMNLLQYKEKCNNICSEQFNSTYCPWCILYSWIFLSDFRFYMDPLSSCGHYEIKIDKILIRLSNQLWRAYIFNHRETMRDVVFIMLQNIYFQAM